MQTCYRHKGRLLLKALKLNMYPCTWTNRLCFVFYVLPRVQVTSTCFLTFSKGWDPVVQSTQVCNGQFFHQLKTQQTKMYLYPTLRPVTTTVTAYSLNYSYKTVNTMFSVLSSSLSWQVICGWVLLVEKALFITLIDHRSLNTVPF